MRELEYITLSNLIFKKIFFVKDCFWIGHDIKYVFHCGP